MSPISRPSTGPAEPRPTHAPPSAAPPRDGEPSAAPGGAAIAADGLCKSYGEKPALAELDLHVRRGEVFGFIGPNGAGKTTTIRILLDLIRPTRGVVRVLGLDPRVDGVELRRRIGYLPGELALYEDLSPRRLLEHLAGLRGGAGRAAIEPLAARLSLQLEHPIRTLSKGNKQKVGLVQALMHEPELLILDEPTSGVDPLIQREFHELIHEARARGQTVFSSSHVLSEIERIADRIGIIREGRLVVVDDVGALKARAARQVDLHFSAPVPPAAFAGLPGVSDARFEGDAARFVVTGPIDPLIKAAARFEVLTMTSHEPDLEELFLTVYAGDGVA
ncbi:MAG: ABC transporter ATP-binding protein [Acidobacteriota bacterium]|nr:ABC transporter ATP-binding protein [Acidobacteriota bacterium]